MCQHLFVFTKLFWKSFNSNFSLALAFGNVFSFNRAFSLVLPSSEFVEIRVRK